MAIRRPSKPLGRWGRERKQYLEQHRPGLNNRLVLSEKLYDHCLEIEDSALFRMEQLLPALAKDAGATEEVEAADQMKRVGLMNVCRNRAEEIVITELIYN